MALEIGDHAAVFQFQSWCHTRGIERQISPIPVPNSLFF